MTNARPTGATSPQPSATSGIINDAQMLASKAAAGAQDAALRLADQQKTAAAEQIDEVARAIDTAAEQVERVLPQGAPYVRAAASAIHQASSTVRDHSIEDLMDMARGFARNQPGTFAAGTVLAGFGLARFLKSSAERRAAPGSRQPSRTSGKAARGPRGQCRAKTVPRRPDPVAPPPKPQTPPNSDPRQE
jgi:ABC-type transporter Mla subunit MlaD